MKTKNALFFLLGLLPAVSFAQQISEVPQLYVGDVAEYPKEMITYTANGGGDTTVSINYYTTLIVAELPFKNKKDKEKYDRLKANVKKAYPYALLAKAKLQEFDAQAQLLKNEAEKKRFAEKCEKELIKQFEKDMRNLTRSQGRILCKLIDRETDHTTFDLIKQYRGSFSATMWQGVARIFGGNLKDDYDAKGDDKLIEHVVNLIDLGVI
ncbi:MAG: hypothetical protein FD123_877 [Bacteroidetes bacterium]|nr:MAG: hypothetical protein FD123_877 [Bacteroidota bacterium]